MKTKKPARKPDCRKAGLQEDRTAGKPDCRKVGLQESRIAGKPDCRKAGLQESRTAGKPDCRKAGLQESRTVHTAKTTGPVDHCTALRSLWLPIYLSHLPSFSPRTEEHGK
jgi:hypothetical protein